MTSQPDPGALLRSNGYVALLVIAALIGAPIAAVAYFFLALVSVLQKWIFTTLPEALWSGSAPVWWPLLPLFVAGILVSLTIKYLPGTGGHSPAEGFAMEGAPTGAQLPGVALAALATLCLGVVLGPEAPLIALGAGLGALTVRLVKRDAPPRTQTMMAAAGSFAAISTLLGSPLTGAFLLMEASGLGGATLGLVLVPGLLAAGIGSLVFIGLNAWTGLGTFSLSLAGLPAAESPTGVQFLWAIVIGLLAVPVGAGIRWLGVTLRPIVEKRMLLLTPVAGLAIAALAIVYALITGESPSDILFSGQDALGPFITDVPNYTIGALVLLIVCKGIAYGISLSSFRGGPTFPALFIGAVGGAALSHLPGLPMIAGVAMGIGAMCVVMLKLPLTSVLLATLILASDGLMLMPLVIVAVVVAHVASARFTPAREKLELAPIPEQGKGASSTRLT
ncbi:chloride channel protein [Microbacterium pumilum]|uniref:Chloride channel protein n=1 Tax=Microbacterium pumilum TaxID=344165 RepID=A0ABP5D3M7_9MICO